MSKSTLARRLTIYCLGIFLMALGVSVSVAADLGVSPVSALPKVLSDLLPSLSMGTWSIIIYAVFILIQAAILRRDFHLSRLLQVGCSLLFGVFVDLTNFLTGLFLPLPELYALRLVYLGVSMTLVALGVFLYLAPHLVSLPAEGVSLAVSQKLGAPVHRCKMGFDVVLVLTAAAVSLMGFGYLNGVGEGTIIAAFGVGKIMGVITKHFGPALNTFIHMPPAEKSPAAQPARAA